MKKKIIIIAVILLVLAAAVKFRVALAYVLLGGETLQLDRSEISSVQGTSVTSVPVKTAKLSESQIDSFIELLNSLELKKIPFRNEKKAAGCMDSALSKKMEVSSQYLSWTRVWSQ